MRPAKAIVDVAGLELTTEDKAFLKHPLIAGVILFARNYESKNQLRALTRSLHEINPEFMICVDQEGGRVQRFVKHFSPLESMRTFGALYRQDADRALRALRKQLVTMVSELKEVGVTATLIPVVDLDHGRSDIIGERSLGADPDAVVQLANLVIDTLHEFGMPATLKHFPGHGFVVADSHLDLPIDERPFEIIQANDMVPFVKLLQKADYVMPAHIVFPCVDQNPVGFSPVWLKTILRDRMGFKGKIMTDDLSMQGAARWAGDYSARASAAIDAGCDLLLVCNDRDGAIDVVGTIEKRMAIWQKSHSSLTDSSLSYA